MSRHVLVSTAIALCFSAACRVRNPIRVSPAAADRAADVTVAIHARSFEFDPSEIRVKQGQVVELQLVAAGRKHGFGLTAFGIRTEPPEGSPVTVRFVADRRGEFGFRCNVFCGLGHLGMRGRLIVE